MSLIVRPQFVNVLKEPRNRFRQAGNRLLGSFKKGLQIRALHLKHCPLLEKLACDWLTSHNVVLETRG
jgi:hypothetical protein